MSLLTLLLLTFFTCILSSPIYFDQKVSLCTHNAFANDISDIIAPNQDKDFDEQLADGVRSFMIDTYIFNNQIRLCHTQSSEEWCTSYFIDFMVNNILHFLESNTNEIITIIIEDHVDDRSQYESVWSHLQNNYYIADYIFNPFDSIWDPTSSHWPTINNMIANNKRLLIFNQRNSNSGYFASNSIYIMSQFQWTVENTFSLGTTALSHDYSCNNRGESSSLSSTSVRENGFNWIPLFIMNHFHSVPLKIHASFDNEFGRLNSRYENNCKLSSNNKIPNFIALDFYENGDSIEYVNFWNEGSFILYEGNSGTQDIVCSITPDSNRNINFQNDNIGCENDEARSLKLVNINEGTILVLYDSPNFDKNDDYIIIEIKTFVNDEIISTFESSMNTNSYKTTVIYNNGLDGKVSAAKVFVTPNRVLIYEGESIYSDNKRYKLILQSDGNLVLYDLNTNKPLWASNTVNRGTVGTRKLILQTDNNLVLYSGSTALWSTGTQFEGTGGANFYVQNDGNLVLYAPNVLWASGTNQ